MKAHHEKLADRDHAWVLATPPQMLISSPAKYGGTSAWWICHCGASKLVRVDCDEKETT